VYPQVALKKSEPAAKASISAAAAQANRPDVSAVAPDPRKTVTVGATP
jgi:hypothetical protein